MNIAAVIKRGGHLYTQNWFLWRPQNEIVMSHDVGISSLKVTTIHYFLTRSKIPILQNLVAMEKSCHVKI